MYSTGGPLTTQANNVPTDQSRPHQPVYSISQSNMRAGHPLYGAGNLNTLAYQTATVKRSMSFFSTAELVSYKTVPIVGACAYLASAVGSTAMDETFVQQKILAYPGVIAVRGLGWFGSEYTGVTILNSLTAGSWLSFSCYIYGRRHIRHAGNFQRIIYPLYASTFFIAASHFSWAFLKDMLRNQDSLDYHWRCMAGVTSGLMFLYIGKSYLRFIDHW